MKVEQILDSLNFTSENEGFTDITSNINYWIQKNNLKNGILLIFSLHTSCSLIINENADKNVLKDLSNYMNAIVPQESFLSINGSSKKIEYLHSDEGKDDMPAHIKNMLTSTNISISFRDSRLVLGTWQALYLWEHRQSKRKRILHLHAIGDIKVT